MFLHEKVAKLLNVHDIQDLTDLLQDKKNIEFISWHKDIHNKLCRPVFSTEYSPFLMQFHHLSSTLNSTNAMIYSKEYKTTSLQNYYALKHGIALKYPLLPVVVDYGHKNQEVYYAMETLLYHDKYFC